MYKLTDDKGDDNEHSDWLITKDTVTDDRGHSDWLTTI